VKDLPILPQGLSAVFKEDLPANLFIRRLSGGLAGLISNSHGPSFLKIIVSDIPPIEQE
jgi:hypothetical protein